jgi:hypothetical protein
MRSLALRRALWAWLAFALVTAQGLGFMHRIVHGPQAHLAASASAASPHGVAALFASHDDDATCRLLDAMGHDAAPTAAVVILPFALPSFVVATLRGECLARWRALFDARGPPAIR